MGLKSIPVAAESASRAKVNTTLPVARIQYGISSDMAATSHSMFASTTKVVQSGPFLGSDCGGIPEGPKVDLELASHANREAGPCRLDHMAGA